ncbi:MAG: hypothetical protein XU15_C0011G0049 [candidate division NC10 bacterium CSP1-5]|nr:MAG: hypothetical protein XU15_C0011G0049 [candidate division NC10 bacterium CSP1-5]
MSKKKITEVVVDEDAATTQLDFALLEAAEAALEGIKYTAKDLDITLFPDSYPGRRVSPEEVRVAATVGILQPIDLEEDDKGGYIVRDGHRRIMMAHAAVKEYDSKRCRKIRAHIYPSDGVVGSMQTLILNNTRSSNPLAEFSAILELEKEGYSDRQIAVGTGMDTVTIKKRRKLAKLDKRLRRAWAAGKMTNLGAEVVAAWSKTYQDRLAEMLEDGEHEKITAKDLAEVRTERREAATASLPTSMFQNVPTGTVESWAAVSRRNVQRILAGVPQKAQDVREALEDVLATLERYP